MIVFCEDCGRKNTVGPDVIQNGVVDFYCSACQYHNRYPGIHKQHQNPCSKLTRHLDTLSSHKAIKGYYLFHLSKGVLYRRMPSSLKDKNLLAMGKSLAESYQVTKKLFSDIRHVKITLSRYEIRLIHICNHVFFILVNEYSGIDDNFKKMLDDHLLLLKKMIVSQGEII